MKKIILILTTVFLGSILLLIVAAEIISFKIFKKTTDQINKDLTKKFQQIVRIPDVISPSYKGFYETTYSWDMETPQKEIIKVIFTHNTGFSKSQNKITASVYMEPTGDASLFNKVLPAVVADSQALTSAQDQEHANLGPNNQIGYNKLNLEPVSGDFTKVTKLTWEFDKDNLTVAEADLYKKLYRFPESVLKILYTLQQITISLFAA